MKRLIATDYDGTFSRGGISEFDIEAVKKWRKAGNYFGFVTGRGTDFFDLCREKGIETDYFLVYNGSMLALGDGTPVKEYFIPAGVFSRLSDFFSRVPDVRYYDKPSGEDFYHHFYASFDCAERALEVGKEANALFGEEVTAFVNGPHVNIGVKGSGKAQGVFDALEYFGLPDDAAAVFGDDYNDLEMITAHNGWAVSSAREEVLKVAPHVCGSVGEAALMLLEQNSKL